MTASTNALDNVLAQAQAAAASKAVVAMESQHQEVSHYQPQNTGLAKPGAGFIDAGGIDVDAYLKVDKAGFKLGDAFKGFVDELLVSLDLSEVVYIYQCRAENPGSGAIQYLKSYDGISTVEGKNFLAEVNRFDTTYLKSTGIYETMEIPLTLSVDVQDPKYTTVVEEGSTLGLTPPPTGLTGFRKILKKVRANGGDPMFDVVNLRLKHDTKTNKANQEYGVVEWELLTDA